ncbi:MAG: hypothetical protein DWH91_02325 [Planctomycetota bacterium]|nr:MAG: hypothetical protein DWH91_02325 [Planctomycetota bacterium]
MVVTDSSDFSAHPAWKAVAFTDGGAGMISQVRGLMAASGAIGELRQAPLCRPWKWLWPGMIPTAPWVFCDPGTVHCEEPPDLVITCGRQSIMASLLLKRYFGSRVLTVHTQDPRIAPERFDLVACPLHDGLVGPQVIGTLGALHHLTPTLLSEQASEGRRAGLEKLTQPFALVLLGGPTRNYAFTNEELAAFQQRLDLAIARGHQQLAILPSKRTPARWIDQFVARYGREQFVWPRTGENPYLPALALASHVIVTCDSVNMISEAATTTRPVYVEHLIERRTARRFRSFHQSFELAGITRPFRGTLESWTYRPPQATEQVAQIIRERLLTRQPS